jgi:cytochrome P450
VDAGTGQDQVNCMANAYKSGDLSGVGARSLPGSLPRMSIGHSLGFWLRVALPTWAKGIIIRRPGAVAMAERFDLDARAVRYMEQLHAAYGGRSVLVRNPVRLQAVALDPDDVRTVLHDTPDPFTPATDEKRSALGHFEPRTSLVSRGAERKPRRRLNEEVLETAAPVHSHAVRFRAVIGEEMQRLLADASAIGELAWPAFSEAWFRVVRRIVLGDRAREDHALTEMMARLRGRANWAFTVPRNDRLRQELHDRLQAYVDRAEPGSLAALAADKPGVAEATQQMTQWLFAFDPAGMTIFRALALIASRSEALAGVRAEAASGSENLPFLRACIIETLRLYPTTPVILRQAVAGASLGSGRLPEGSGVLVYSPFFQRASWLRSADRFEPSFWIGRDAEEALPFVPFSAGAAVCPAKNLVPLLGAEALRHLLSATFELVAPQWLKSQDKLRGTLDNYLIRFEPKQAPH